MKFKFNPKNQIQCSTFHSLALLSIFILLFCKHGSVSGETLSNRTDYLALLEFRHHISNDPNGFFKLWNNSHHFCKWQGVKCGVKHQRVVSLMIEDQHIFGTISPHIGNLSFLKVISLQGNNFHGQIPQQIGQLVRLRYLVLANNTVGGRLPTNLSRCLNLVELFLNNNRLLGSIPEELGSLKMLRILHLGQNNLTGFIPRSLGTQMLEDKAYDRGEGEVKVRMSS